MTSIKSYHRPTSIDEALELLAAHPDSAALLAGGTQLVGDLPENVESIIDLQALELSEITGDERVVHLGAMVTLQQMVDHAALPELLRTLAHAAAANTFRNNGTIGGLIASRDAESELLAALLAFECEVRIQSKEGQHSVALLDYLEQPIDGIITQATIQANGMAAVERVGRTPKDVPIVAVVARMPPGGELVLAFSGMGPTPILCPPEKVAALDPPEDFRGSKSYRKHLAQTLTARVIKQIGG